MNGIACGSLVVLLRTTLFLTAAAIAMRLVLTWARPTSPALHRVAWLLVLATGWCWCRLPVTIQYPGTALVKQLPSPVTDAGNQLLDRLANSVEQANFPLILTSSSSPHQKPTCGSGKVGELACRNSRHLVFRDGRRCDWVDRELRAVSSRTPWGMLSERSLVASMGRFVLSTWHSRKNSVCRVRECGATAVSCAPRLPSRRAGDLVAAD